MACHAAAAVLLAFAVLLSLPLQAEAQTTLVSNTGQSSATNLRAVGPVGAFFLYSNAWRFSTGSE